MARSIVGVGNSADILPALVVIAILQGLYVVEAWQLLCVQLTNYNTCNPQFVNNFGIILLEKIIVYLRDCCIGLIIFCLYIQENPYNMATRFHAEFSDITLVYGEKTKHRSNVLKYRSIFG